jgi:pyridinium-3,5-bisthiocarboxylic acid mononucleotide nickel chelatase
MRSRRRSLALAIPRSLSFPKDPMSSPSSAEMAPIPVRESLAIHLDLVGGLSGDMFVAAMIDALPALAEPVLAALATVQPAGAAAPAFVTATRGGLRARRFGLAATDPPPHSHAGTRYVSLRKQIAEAPLSAPTRTHALALLALLADAEAHVHGIAVDDVHFHELADWDSLLDIVAAGCIVAALDGVHWSASAPPLGNGTVRTEHGLLPVPAPATSRLLEGYPWHDDGIGGERVTPTGAAILRHLVPATACATQRETGRLIATGCGAGTRELAGIANIVRALVFERNSSAGSDAVAVLEFDVDDMTGEEIAGAADHLRSAAGVIDVSVGTRSGKKGRPLTDFRLLVQPHAVDAVAKACFAETSTLGLRLRDERRRILSRAEVATTLGDSTVGVKMAERPGGVRTAKAAHDDVAAAPALATRRQARAAAEQRALEAPDE